MDIKARGGYSPKVVTAKANVETVIRVKTSNTYDCSAYLVLPEIKYQKMLEPNGTEEIKISAKDANGDFYGLCGMGMYNFVIKFS